MIAMLRGILIEHNSNDIVLDVNGIGYSIRVPQSNSFDSSAIGTEVVLFIHQVFREDGQYLFGFQDRSSREMFRTLIELPGVGPKLGLTILSNLPPDSIRTAVQTGDVLAFQRISGVGKKIAERIVLELRGKLPEISEFSSGISSSHTSLDEVITALISLGIPRTQAMVAARSALQSIGDQNSPSAEQVIRIALAGLQRK